MTNPTPHGQVPEALRLAQELDAVPETGADPQTIQEAAAELRRLHAYCQELESHLILDCMTHVQNPAPQPSPAAQGDALDAEQHEMDAKHAAIYRWMLGHVADVLSIFDNWLADEEADTDELHDALAARAAQEGK